MTLGEKLKEARRARRLTQRQLAGDRITRNMLSLIEKDKALPSYETLRYLAQQLKIDPGYFFDDRSDLTDYLLRSDMPKIRAAYQKKNYEECIALSNAYKDCADEELLTVLSLSCYNAGIEAFERFSYEDAKAYLLESKTLSERMIVRPHFSVRISFYLALIESYRTGKRILPSTVTSVFPDEDDFFDYAVYTFLLALIETDQIEKATSLYNSIHIGNHLFRSHFNARIAASLNNYQRAKELLWSVVSSDDAKPSPFLYGVYDDLERYCKATDDYEGAYRCAIAKQKMKK